MEHGKGENPIERGEQLDRAGLEANVRNVRALLDQARKSFGPETRRAIDGLVDRTATAERIESEEFTERLDPAAWQFVVLTQLTEIVNGLVVQMTTPASAGAASGVGTGR